MSATPKPATARAANQLRYFLLDNTEYRDFMDELVYSLPHVHIDWNGDEEAAAQKLENAENEILNAVVYLINTNQGDQS